MGTISVIARSEATRQSSFLHVARMDCFVLLAMTEFVVGQDVLGFACALLLSSLRSLSAE